MYFQGFVVPVKEVLLSLFARESGVNQIKPPLSKYPLFDFLRNVGCVGKLVFLLHSTVSHIYSSSTKIKSHPSLPVKVAEVWGSSRNSNSPIRPM